ncbi:1-acyl-sn-glycerol-3-phosphate acyltransferase [Streptacidiphilus jiangxiensis]|uniref:1-acyl-sn-glycerol-3-phosphate acyltransferase n=1 Tax=Streptacidiphilus jiangxiensis TaxID=235985 RepID=UPI0015A6CCA2|nr:1-acyl-sn-glycerol-3-phosphate acyltransferase [Streptacidiphilus jiangxiensis]
MAYHLGTCARRLVSVPLTVVVAALALVAVLLALVTAPLTALARQPWRLLRITTFLLVYACVDLAGVVAAFWFWAHCVLRPDPGQSKSQRLGEHSYELLARLLDRLYRAAERIFELNLRVRPPVPQMGRAAAPLLVFARHAGPGDSFLLLHALLCEAQVHPAVVLKRSLRWDPCLDMLIGRTPHVFVPSPAPETTTDAIANLAAALVPGEAAVIFPEGGNFTQQRRARSISWLRRHGKARRASLAQQRPHVLPPRWDGPLALLGGAAAGMDVVIVAHTGLDPMDTPSRIWRGIPLRAPVSATWWCVPGTAVPAGRAAAGEWLEQQWARVDTWIDEESERTGQLSA